MVAILGVLCVAVAVEKVRAQTLCHPGLYLAIAVILAAVMLVGVAMGGVRV